MDKAEAIERLEYLKARALIALEQEVSEWIAEDVLSTIEAYDMAIEALQTEPLNQYLAKDEPTLVKDLVKAFGEDGTWLERQGVYTLTLAEAKQRAVDIIESVLAKIEPQTDYTPDCPFCRRYGTEDCLGSDCRHYKTYKDEPQTEVTTDCRHSKMSLDDAYYLVYKDLTKEDGILTGKYDAKNGNKQYMNGVWSVMELIAYGVGIDCYNDFNERFCHNLEQSQEQTERSEDGKDGENM